jgi:ribonuclease-3
MGPDHDRKFTVEVKLGNTVLGRGSGKSKKSAEEEAARSALDQLPTYFTP